MESSPLVLECQLLPPPPRQRSEGRPKCPNLHMLVLSGNQSPA